MQHRHRLLGLRDLLQRRLRATAGETRRRAADGFSGNVRRRIRFRAARCHQRAGKPKTDARCTNGDAMIERDRADGFEIAFEYRIGNRSAKTFFDKLREMRAHRVRPARDHREIDETDLGLALPRQHPHQIGIVHRIERMVLQRAFIERHGADEQIALIDRAAGFRKRRRHQHDGVAGIGAQRIHHRPDIAGIGGIEGRADLEQHMRGAAPAHPFFRGARFGHRLRRLDGPALQRHHNGIDLGQLQIIRRHADGLHRAQAAARQRVGKIGRAGVVVGDAAQRQRHDFAPA